MKLSGVPLEVPLGSQVAPDGQPINNLHRITITINPTGNSSFTRSRRNLGIMLILFVCSSLRALPAFLRRLSCPVV